MRVATNAQSEMKKPHVLRHDVIEEAVKAAIELYKLPEIPNEIIRALKVYIDSAREKLFPAQKEK